MAKIKIKDDVSTEEKIKLAARKLFTERGFDAVKTRDIAKEAGINSALLNYYFKSKENLYQIVMLDNFREFGSQIIPIMGDESLPVDEIMAKITAAYIDMLRANPDLPFFIINSIRNNVPMISMVDTSVAETMVSVREAFIKRMKQLMSQENIEPVHSAHYMMNFIGLVIFPFIARSLVMRVNNMSDEMYDELMVERKTLVPLWLKAMAKAK